MAENEFVPETDMNIAAAHEPTTEPPESQRLLDRPLADMVRLDWETVAWILLFVVAALSRFYDLGVRAMSHDESLHTLYSYYLYDAGNYEHNPMMHGPFLFHANALIYSLFGHTDATARIVPALAGMGVIWMARLSRRYIGRMGALMAGLLIVVSPSLLFHSRYIRNDIYIALFVMIWIYAAFRYLDTRRFKWILVMTLGMALGFVTKENHFMNGAVIGAFFAALALWQLLGRGLFAIISPLILAVGFAYWFHVRDQDNIALIVVGAAALAALGLTLYYMMAPSLAENWRKLRTFASADLAVLMLTLVLPFTAPFGHLALGWDAMAYTESTDVLRSVLLVGILTLLALILAYYWYAMKPQPDDGETGPVASMQRMSFGDWGMAMALFWIIQVLFFTTFFTNIQNGLATGIVGSLGYWLAQQEVARGGQPWYYYVMLGGLYEFLPLLLSGVGIGVAIYGANRNLPWDPVSSGDLPDVVEDEIEESRDQTDRSHESDAELDGPDLSAAIDQRYLQNRSYYMAFSIWWIIGSWGAYTIAGEKMPWLMTHMALPMCIVGGWLLGRLIRGVDWKRAAASHTVWLIGLTPAFLFALGLFLGNLPQLGRSTEAVSSITQWLTASVILGGLIYAGWYFGRRAGWADAARLLGLGGVALLFLLTIRFSYMLTFVNYDMATEYLVYAHATPDVKRALAEIDLISERTVGERNVAVAYDDDTSWPMSWYMRLYPNAKFYGASPNSDAMSSPVIIVGPKNYEAVHPYVVRDYVKRPYRLIWWPDQGYFNWTPQRAWETISDPQKLQDLLQIVFYRRYAGTAEEGEWRDLTQWPNRHEFEMWVRRDIAADIWDLGVAPVALGADSLASIPETDLTAVAIQDGVYDNLPLSNPRALAVGPDGARYIADTDNHRIVVLDASGAFLRAFGSHCNLADSEASGCVDPDGAGPGEAGDGQFYEPWGIAVDGQGHVYVADTWNGRIQVFDDQGELLRKWGYFGATDGELGDANALFGPRGMAIDNDGDLLVADTGNKRVLRFAPDGALVQQIGGGGVIPGRFDEPTDVAVDPGDGSVYVADAWNRRIQKFASDLSFAAEWAVPSWESQDRLHKPYLTVAYNGDVHASDPAMYRVFVYAPDGEIKTSYGRFGVEANRFGLPNGLATDPMTGDILVADAGNGRVMVFPPLP